jgi:hypothetical protein
LLTLKSSVTNYLLADTVDFTKGPGGRGKLTITMTDPQRPGIVNGGHTFAAVRDVVDNEVGDGASLAHTFVRLHVMQGIEVDRFPRSRRG